MAELRSGLDPAATLDWLRGRQDDICDLTVAMAQIESPSRDAAAQEPLRELLTTELTGRGFDVERLPGQDGCDHLLARPAGFDEDQPTQLILGHIDTVWPVGTLAKMPLEVTGDELHGPGVFDMKAGIAQALFALDAIREQGAEPECQPVLLITADEEISSPSSREWIVDLAASADRAFVLEPGHGPAGDLKTGRKGIGRFTLIATGVASHAGLEPEAGVSAILELSRQVQALFELNDAEREITVNVGTIDGGVHPNVIAPEAIAEIEARVLTQADAQVIESTIRGLKPLTEGTSLAVEGGFVRPPMEPNAENLALWNKAQAAAERLGLEVSHAEVGGGSDGNLTSPLTATLDGLGAVGAGAHADYEHVVVSRMPERAALLAMLLMEPGRVSGA